MRTIVGGIVWFIFLFFFVSSTFGQAYLNVRDYGAKGDGKTDDAPIINQVLKAANAQNKSVYFPAGTYLCNTISDNENHILVLAAGRMKNFNIYGDPGGVTRITTSLNAGTALLYIYAYAICEDLTIQNIFFENTHSVINAATQAIFLQGTNGQLIRQSLLTGCRFEGFCNAVEGQGVLGWTIDQNVFASPKGHDNAKNDTDPAVYCWFFDNANGYCRDIRITNNIADGYTGTGPIGSLVTKRAMDGFIFGTGYGFTITGNTTRNFSEEHYLLTPRATFLKDTTPTLIANNYIDGTIPTGSMDDNGTRQHLVNYAIRCDISNATIRNNEIHDYTYGIMIRGVDYPKANIHSYTITGNKLYAAADTVNYSVQNAISVQGNIGNRIKDIQVTGNEIHIGALRRYINNSGILLTDLEKGVIQNNNVSSTYILPLGSQLTALGYRRVGRIQESSNQVLGMKFRNILSPTDTVQIITDGRVRNQ